jgi:hypothetical protein
MSDDMFPEEEKAFYQKHKIAVRLAVSTADQHFLVRSEDGALPHRPLWKAYTSRQVAQILLHELTGLTDGEYVLLRQVGFYDDEPDDPLTVLYAAEIAERVPVAQGFSWVKADKLSLETAAWFAVACHYRKP